MNLPLQLKESPFLRTGFDFDPASGEFEGYGAIFGNVDSHRDMILPGAFARTLASHKAAGTTPVLLWGHNPDKLVGRWLEIEEDDVGLRVRGRMNLKTTAGREAFAHVTDGDATGLSIGYVLPPGGSQTKGSIRYLERVELVEISVVAIPSNGQARIKLDSKGDLETFLTKSGLAKEAARRIAFGGWSALSGPDQSKATELATEIARMTAQLKAL